MPQYEVKAPSGRKLVVEARDSSQAKRLACKKWGIKPSDYWCGVTSLKARKVDKTKEERRNGRGQGAGV
ncbi:Uncharacterized [Moorella glycerini]|jgi:hypothetical protein|uniref:Uncharacterized protein n=1 Tax=Neomoorella stamsii TaxID=1266720 RepID=A0A9X7J4J7_9FIRM|nr:MULTISPECIES: hypothetical protein [Moorella]PRR76296.1 hypothetical protein MOST_04570 [Moorella stamsii]CEP67136.1 Uncharacterized [Moorella glycerini]